jgi:adenine-specific DNA-methyltransferase
MTNEEIKKREIESALAAMNGGDFLQTSKKLLEVLNYHGPLIEELPETVEDFIQEYPAEKTDTKTEQEFRKNAKSIELVSQVGSDEIVDSQPDRFESRTFDKGLIKSFVFCTVELKDKDYSRSKYAEFTREINKRTTLATVVFFRVKNRLTIGFVGRRPSQLDESKDVLEKATLIKDIRLDNPHRAHLDILFELSLKECAKWMTAEEQPKNFDGLLEAWLARLGTEELNKKFYQELFAWFKWAVKEATFPTDKNRSLDPEEHVIRLITRLLFVWFIKEKGLVADELFNETQVSPLLKNYDRDTGDSYYRVVLQNLFFATLNTEIEKREFSQGGNSVHRNFSLYRYEDQMLDPDKLLGLFAQTPFINGGLFDCLDSFKATGDGGYRIDCFSDKHYTKLSIPDRLFFDDRGLIPLLEHYKFTVEENTPIEQDVALDPELLGKVFENLLAEYNPQAGVTAQKQTGSYYTRRIIVDYMVDEALVAVLSQKCNVAKDWLRSLLDYAQTSDSGKKWSDNPEADCIVEAISQLKIIDPAVGSGAFPMGILHKLTLALRRLDPDNNRWEQLQQDHAGKRAEAAFKISNQQERDVELAEISDTFERYRDSDFGRKLYLIQNGIFGVDIQPVACQIAKLRFFISLAIEQEPTQEADNNFGIKPLPNLETRFVTANTLIGLQLSEARSLLQDDAVQQLLKEIEVIREKHVLANNRGQKLRLEAQEEDLHKRLEEELEIQRRKWVESQQREIEQKAARLPKPEQRKKWREEEQKKYRWRKKKFDSDFEYARKIISWKPYDQNASADFFDPEWMFGIRDGFDITIGNPPYVRADSGDEHLKMRQKIEDSNQYETLWEKWDLYIPFIERSYKLLKPGGFTTLIVSDAYCHSKYAQKSQNWFLKNSRILRLDFFSKIKIFDAGVRNITYLFQKVDGSRQQPERRVHNPEVGAVTLLPTDEQCNLTYRAFFPEDINLQQFLTPTVALSDICYISYGLTPSSNEKTAKGEFTTSDLVADKKDELHCKPFVEGKHLDYWLPVMNLWLEYGSDRAPSQFRRPTFPEMYTVGEKILAQRSPGPDPKVCYDNQYLIFTPSSVGFILWHSLSGIRNRSIKKLTRYRDEKPRRLDLPQREDLEKISPRFAVKFLLGVMNSATAHDFLRANRRSNIHLYPDDWKKLPIPDVPLEQQEPIIELVDQILAAKRTNPDADVSELENEIDQIVYLLYGLTPE